MLGSCTWSPERPFRSAVVLASFHVLCYPYQSPLLPTHLVIPEHKHSTFLLPFAPAAPLCMALLQSKLPAAQYDSSCNLLRWFNLIQHTADSCKLFTPVHIPLPAFVPPPPPAVSAKTGAKSTAASTATVSGVWQDRVQSMYHMGS